MSMVFELREGVPVLRPKGLIPGVGQVVSTRLGGVSGGPYRSLNMGLGVGDEAQDVLANRVRWAHASGCLIDESVWMRQTHGANVVEVDRGDAGRGAQSLEHAIADCDALFTVVPNLSLAALTADCVPISLAHRHGKGVGIAHSGRRGTLLGIAGKLVAAMAERMSCVPADLAAFVGPSIGPCCYDVGAEVREDFERNAPAMATKIFAPIAGQPRWALDLWEGNRIALRSAGVESIEVAAICTSCLKELFFSERGNGAPTGRFVSQITIDS